MKIKRMVEGTARKVARYEFSTPKEEITMKTQAQVQHETTRRAEELAMREGYQGPGRFAERHYKLALAERSPSQQETERGFAPGRGEPSQQERASRHFAQQIKTYMDRGLSRVDAISVATQEHLHSGLGHISLPKNSPWAAQGEQEQREEANRYAMASGSRIGYEQVKLHDAGPGSPTTTHDEKSRTPLEVLVRQVAASVLYRDASQPGEAERNWLDHWFGVVHPAPRPVSGGGNAAELADYNRERENFLDDMMERARQLLRDPAERAKLRPTRLGG